MTSIHFDVFDWLFKNKLRMKTKTPQIELVSLKKAHWNAEEMANVELIAAFVQKLMNDHEFDHVIEN